MKFHNHNGENEVETLIAIMAKLPGLGPRSARRAVIRMLEKKEIILEPLAKILNLVTEKIKNCNLCGNFSIDSVCTICSDNSRNKKIICIVQDVADLWAMERSQIFDGVYHVLGNYSSSYIGINLEELEIEKISNRIEKNGVKEIILALSGTLEGDTTAFYLTKQLETLDVEVTSISRGIPVGGELEYADEVTLGRSIITRSKVNTN